VRRSLEDVYPVPFLDAFVVKFRAAGSAPRRACHLALADLYRD
jgi:transposase-like protein